ncbi:outer membrane protein [Rhodoplanes sp.]|uniref:outer membrane protein n=1 Tax=Rhodoplanes sp. TaxID=1968906 RepID=UPI0025FB02FD|nr:outer membrane protein [Rhodoplanes sp.]
MLAAVAASAVMPAAYAADMALKAQPMVPVVDPWNWTGFYVGGNVGYSWGRAKSDYTDVTTTSVRTRDYRGFTTPQPTLLSDTTVVGATTTIFGDASTNVNGALGGLQAGYNFQSGRFVFGLETDFQWTGQRGDTTVCAIGCVTGSAFTTVDHKLAWFGTGRGRVGVTVDRYLVYATGGLAYGRINSDYAAGFIGGAAALLSTDRTRVGWTAGAGVEAFLTRNWTVKLEYLYVDLGDYGDQVGGASATSTVILQNTPQTALTRVIDTTSTRNTAISTGFTDNILRVGINYKFDPTPVVARY